MNTSIREMQAELRAAKKRVNDIAKKSKTFGEFQETAMNDDSN